MGVGKVHPTEKIPYVKMQKGDVQSNPPAMRQTRPLHFQPAAQPPKRRRGGSPCCCILSSCCCFLLAILLLLIVLPLAIWLDLSPQVPAVNLQHAKVNALDLTPNVTTRTFDLNADIEFAVQITNPNKKIVILYDQIDIATSYSGTQFAQSSVPAFVQDTLNTTVVTSDLKVSHYPLTEALGSALNSDIQKQDVPLLVEVAVTARVRVPSWHYTSFAFTIKITCNVRVSPPSASGQGARMLSKTCSVSGP